MHTFLSFRGRVIYKMIKLVGHQTDDLGWHAFGTIMDSVLKAELSI